MTVFELVDRLNGQILANKARVTVDGVSVIVGRYDGDKMVFTDEGRALADAESNVKAAESEKPARKAKPAVESTVVFTDSVDVQQK